MRSGGEGPLPRPLGALAGAGRAARGAPASPLGAARRVPGGNEAGGDEAGGDEASEAGAGGDETTGHEAGRRNDEKTEGAGREVYGGCGKTIRV